jgi:2-iminoacetate synthase ThiH
MNEKEALKTLKDSGLKVIKEYTDSYTNDTYDQLFETIYDMSADECSDLCETIHKICFAGSYKRAMLFKKDLIRLLKGL